IIDSFEIKECRSLTSENPIKGIPTLFDQLRKHGVPYFLAGFHESEFEGRMTKRALRALTKDYRLILFRMASPDRLGHRYGPESDEVGRRLAEIDASVKELVMWGIQVNPSTHFIILSDHGMTPVKGSIDLLSVLKRLPPEMPRDYVVFLNSTVASLWFNSGEARAAVKTELEKIEQGMILDKAKLKELEIDGIGSEYGELLFALKEGQVFFPDFYRRRKIPKGMHGYAFAKHDKPPFIIYSPGALYKPKRDATARFIDVMPTILGLLDLPVLTTCEGRNLLKSRNQ
ncbi:MAG: alkaline phosphatase family protein, partial [Dehalococcoidia bacterium]|nr:alkaline phosphatase family protein [Dehalococcoidia bacterium]